MTIQKKPAIPQHILEDAVEKYIEDRKLNNIARLSDFYDVPYSTLRRYLLSYIEDNNLSSILVEEHLPLEGFEYLQLGDTFQFAEHLTLWEVKEYRRVDGEQILVLVPTKVFSERHWLCDEMVGPLL